MGWLSRLFGARGPARPPVPVPSAGQAPPTSDAAVEPAQDFDPPPAGLLLAALLGGSPPAEGAATPDEQRLVSALDQVIAQGDVADDLLPRAAAFVPQLMALLRQPDATLAEVAARIAQDAPLAGEVLRAATSAAHGAAEVQDLQQAVQRVGSAGVQQAVARVVFRPMYGGGSGSLGARAAPWLWLFAQRLADAASERARASGLPPLDGYLAGLLHGTGWTVALRVADKAQVDIALPQSEAAAAAIEARVHRLFGLASRRWQVTPGFARFAEDALQTPWASSSLPLARCTLAAQATLLAPPAR